MNWDMIADMINTMRPNHAKHSPDSCRSRWRSLMQLSIEAIQKGEIVSAVGLPQNHLPRRPTDLEYWGRRKNPEHTSKSDTLSLTPQTLNINVGRPDGNKRKSKPISYSEAFKRAAKKRETAFKSSKLSYLN